MTKIQTLIATAEASDRHTVDHVSSTAGWWTNNASHHIATVITGPEYVITIPGDGTRFHGAFVRRTRIRTVIDVARLLDLETQS